MSLHDFDAKARIDHLKHDGSTLCPPHASESLNSYVQHSMRWFRLLASTVHLSSLISDIGKEKHFLYVQLYFFFKKKKPNGNASNAVYMKDVKQGGKRNGVSSQKHTALQLLAKPSVLLPMVHFYCLNLPSPFALL